MVRNAIHSRRNYTLVSATTAALCMAAHAHAASVIRNNVAASLNDVAAWTGGAVPTADDVATWNSTSVGGSQSIGGSLSWGGVYISGSTPTAGPTITDPGGAVLTLGASGINLGNGGVATNRGITLNTAIVLGVDQEWQTGNQSSSNIATTGIISGSGKLTVKPHDLAGSVGVLNLQNGASTYSGGTVIQPGVIATVSTPATLFAASGGALTSSVFGTGPLTINGGRINIGSRSYFNPAININSDFTLAGTNRTDLTGTLNLGGGTRTLTLTRAVTPANVIVGGGNNSMRFTTAAGGTAATTLTNGTLRIAADSTVAAGSYVVVNIASNTLFNGHAGLTIADKGIVTFATSFPWTNSTSPALTVENGGTFALSDTNASRSITVFSLAGAGTVVNLSSNAAAQSSQITVHGEATTGTTDFSGVIRDTDTTNFAITPGTRAMSVTKNGNTTQVLSGLNTYTGSTFVVAGTLAANTILDGGTPSSIGASASGATGLFLSGGTLRYTGAAASSNRLFTVRTTGGTLESAGVGALSLTATGAIVTEDPLNRASNGTTGSTTLQLNSTDLVTGLTIAGTHIAAGTTIVSVDRFNNTVTLSQPLIADATNLDTTFGTADRTLMLTGIANGTNQLAGTLTNSTGGAKLSIRKAGAGTWRLSGSNAYTGVTTLEAGTLRLAPAAQTPVLTGAGGAAIAGGSLELEYAGSTIAASVNAAIASGKIVGPGLAANQSLGWSDNAVDVVRVARTLRGDATLDGAVNFDDLLKLAASYNQSGNWSTGDFNYDGAVNFDDLLALASNYNQAFSGSFAGDWSLAQAAVPEPTTLLALVAPAVLALGRRRRDATCSA
jgi:fibronectin-binding autotransporter adhesin